MEDVNVADKSLRCKVSNCFTQGTWPHRTSWTLLFSVSTGYPMKKTPTFIPWREKPKAQSPFYFYWVGYLIQGINLPDGTSWKLLFNVLAGYPMNREGLLSENEVGNDDGAVSGVLYYVGIMYIASGVSAVASRSFSVGLLYNFSHFVRDALKSPSSARLFIKYPSKLIMATSCELLIVIIIVPTSLLNTLTYRAPVS